MAETSLESIFDMDKRESEKKGDEATDVNPWKRPRVSADSSVSEAGDFSALNTEIQVIKEQMNERIKSCW